MTDKKIKIAIDGPSGAGKSTIAKEVARILSIDYIDTGAMYRAVAYKLKCTGTDMEDARALDALLSQTDIDFSNGTILLDGCMINAEIRNEEIGRLASRCSALGAVREKLVTLQRKMGNEKSVIMDGRDIGTNVLPDAPYKFFLTALAEERARRRHLELLEKGELAVFEQVLKDIVKRDKDDTERALNPLRKAEDAIEIDTTGLNAKQVTALILEAVGFK